MRSVLAEAVHVECDARRPWTTTHLHRPRPPCQSGHGALVAAVRGGPRQVRAPGAVAAATAMRGSGSAVSAGQSPRLAPLPEPPLVIKAPLFCCADRPKTRQPRSPYPTQRSSLDHVSLLRLTRVTIRLRSTVRIAQRRSNADPLKASCDAQKFRPARLMGGCSRLIAAAGHRPHLVTSFRASQCMNAQGTACHFAPQKTKDLLETRADLTTAVRSRPQPAGIASP